MTASLAKKLIWGIGIIVAVAIAAVAFVPDIDVRIPEKTVRTAIDDRIPETYGSADGIQARITSADVNFLEDGENGSVKLAADVKLSGFGLAGSGSAKTTTSVRYENGAFYLSDLALDDFELKPSLATRAKLRAWKKVLETFLDETAESIRDQNGDAAFFDFEDRRRTFGPIVTTAIEEKLGSIPVYRLQGGPAQYAIFLVLQDVRFNDKEAIATLSPAKAILTIATGLIILLCLILIAWTKLIDARSSNRDNDQNSY